MVLAVASPDTEAAVDAVERHMTGDLDPEARARAARAVDFDAEETECPACGSRFATDQRRCPDCGLNFGE